MSAFPKKEQAQDVVEIRVGQQDGLDGTVARGLRGRLQTWEGLDLRAEIGRGVDQEPALAIGADGHAGLGARRNDPLPRLKTIRAGTIPLGQSAARRRS